MDIICLIVVIISQGIHISKHQVVQLTYNFCQLNLNKAGKKKSASVFIW